MLTLDAVRTAVLSDQPWARLDALIRAELAQGFTTRQLTKAMERFAHDIDETEGLSEAGSDAFGDALDALTGFCHKDCQYRDPPNPQLPSEEELAELPRWARVAFAARCARRVLPLYQFFWSTAPAGEYQRLNSVTDYIEQVASQEIAPSRAVELPEDAAVKVAVAASVVGRTLSQLTARCVARAAQVISAQGEYALPNDDARSVREMLDVVVELTQGTETVTTSGSVGLDGGIAPGSAFDNDVVVAGGTLVFPFPLLPHIRRDFDHLAQLAEVRRWDDDTPVPPDVFGPLWPEGPPKGWPANTDAPARAELVIEAFARDEATEKKIEDDLVNLFNALNRYHIARGGRRLKLEDFRSLVSAHALVEV